MWLPETVVSVLPDVDERRGRACPEWQQRARQGCHTVTLSTHWKVTTVPSTVPFSDEGRVEPSIKSLMSSHWQRTLSGRNVLDVDRQRKVEDTQPARQTQSRWLSMAGLCWFWHQMCLLSTFWNTKLINLTPDTSPPWMRCNEGEVELPIRATGLEKISICCSILWNISPRQTEEWIIFINLFVDNYLVNGVTNVYVPSCFLMYKYKLSQLILGWWIDTRYCCPAGEETERRGEEREKCRPWLIWVTELVWQWQWQSHLSASTVSQSSDIVFSAASLDIKLLGVSIRYCRMRKSQMSGTRSLRPPLLENCSNKALIVFNMTVFTARWVGTNHMLGTLWWAPGRRGEEAGPSVEVVVCGDSAGYWTQHLSNWGYFSPWLQPLIRAVLDRLDSRLRRGLLFWYFLRGNRNW